MKFSFISTKKMETKLEYYGILFINVLVSQNYQLKRAC